MNRKEQEILDSVKKVKASIGDIEKKVTKSDFEEICLGLDSCEFFLNIHEFKKTEEEISRLIAILKLYKEDDGTLGSPTCL